MVLYKNATVQILEESTTENDEGDLISAFSVVETIQGDVQPARLTEEERKVYGLSERKGQIRKFFYNGLHQNVKAGNRARVASSLSGTTEDFEIMPVQCWTRHGLCLLVPVENEAEEEPEPTPEPDEPEGNEGENE